MPNLFFSAIHYPLRRQGSHELAEYFPSLRTSPRTDDGLSAALEGFCQRRADEIRTLLETRGVQTNEVNRCAAFVPAFELVFRHGGGRALGLIDLGTSAGLNLLWDRFHYRHGTTLDVGPGDSPVLIECELLGLVRPPMPSTFPAVGQRIGLDRSPINLEIPTGGPGSKRRSGPIIRGGWQGFGRPSSWRANAAAAHRRRFPPDAARRAGRRAGGPDLLRVSQRLVQPAWPARAG